MHRGRDPLLGKSQAGMAKKEPVSVGATNFKK